MDSLKMHLFSACTLQKLCLVYSRFKAFVFLTVLIFGVVGLIAFLQSGPLTGKLSQTVKGPVAIKETQNFASLQSSEIPSNWRDDVGVPVLCYHQIVTEEKYRDRPTPYAVTVGQFHEQMEWLAENNFYTIFPDDLLAYVRGEKKLNFAKGKRPIVITFDDGNNDFVTHAQRILDKYNFKAVLFIYPTYIFAHKPRSLTWAQINAVRTAGHQIESHTMWHPLLNTMTETEQRAQFADSKKNLDAKGGANVKHLAYPFGIYNAKSLELLKEVGYRSAYTTFYGGNQIGENPYLLRRFLIVKNDNAEIFAQKTLAHSLPLRFVDSEPGVVIDAETTLRFKLPANLKNDNFKVRIFSTKQNFHYDTKSGEMAIPVIPAKKRFSVLEIVYTENGVEYRANAFLNHKHSVGSKETLKQTKKTQHEKI